MKLYKCILRDQSGARMEEKKTLEEILAANPWDGKEITTSLEKGQTFKVADSKGTYTVYAN